MGKPNDVKINHKFIGNIFGNDKSANEQLMMILDELKIDGLAESTHKPINSEMLDKLFGKLELVNSNNHMVLLFMADIKLVGILSYPNICYGNNLRRLYEYYSRSAVLGNTTAMRQIEYINRIGSKFPSWYKLLSDKENV